MKLVKHAKFYAFLEIGLLWKYNKMMSSSWYIVFETDIQTGWVEVVVKAVKVRGDISWRGDLFKRGDHSRVVLI